MAVDAKKRILLVEDEALIAFAGKRVLERCGYEVFLSHSGEDAAARAVPGAFDLILMDIDLGSGMDGAAAAEFILREQDLPVVFLSSHMDRETVEKTERITSYGYVVKSSNETVLDASIKMAFKLFEARRRSRNLARVYSFLSGINRSIIRAVDVQNLFQEACELAVSRGDFKMAWIGRLDPGTRKVSVAAAKGFSIGYLDRIDIDLNDAARSAGPTGRALLRARHEVCSDILNDPLMEPWRDAARHNGYQSSASFPLVSRGAAWGALSVYSSEPSFFDEAEVELLDEVAEDIAFSVDYLAQKRELRSLLDACESREGGKAGSS